ncbi:MAG: hypothetical protein HDR01_14835 [Lachnospiraceae bacterium]|nr:hypothetical protein [Lachnospiraceae bacterium]
MRNYLKHVTKGMFVLVLAFFFMLQAVIQAEAKTAVDTVNGVTYSDSESISVGYLYSFFEGAGGDALIQLSNRGDRVTNVKSSSTNLLAKKTYESYDTSTSIDYDTKQKTVSSRYYTTYISFFAKKAGTYTVTFDIVKQDGTVRCTKSIKVKASGSTASSPIKKITYAGKDLYSYYPFTTKGSGKLKVTMKAAYKLVSIEVGSCNKKGEITYKKVKNNKKISLVKKAVYTNQYNYSAGGTKYMSDELFPTTYIRITYQNKKKKETGTWVTALHTINKKQSW